MPTVALPSIGTDAAWRAAARAHLGAGTPPEALHWQMDGGGDLFAEPAAPLPEAAPVTVPRAFAALAGTVVWHRDPERFARLYALLWRLRTQRGALQDRADPAVARLWKMDKEVHRDLHKMRAFLRFREIGAPDLPRRRFAAWFEPGHHIVEPIAPWFANRFGDMDMVILTPDLTLSIEDRRVALSPGQAKPPLPDDAHEALWTTYFRNIFNPARLKVKAMQAEMPKKYWKNMPEASAIPDLIAGAEARVRQMQAAAPTLPPARAAKITERWMTETQEPPPADSLEALRRQAEGCTRCALHGPATQVVMGEGPRDADLMIVGEQPGDQEDLMGRPFVGPAGQLFDRLAEEAGLDRAGAFVTNAVKHFKFQPRGKRRIHQRPGADEVQACRWWLDAERALVRPKLILAMGATAAASLTGTGAGLLKRRGTWEAGPDGTPVFLTLHPSYLLRVPDASARARATDDVRADLAAVQARVQALRAA
ncbi:DUF4130 domain-containing protein [Rhodobacteraceae bacterium CCMM004]|nr:DUF4130 domain-containing protein [Rhodobacteraceae bacterium CCMM004]